MSAIDFANSYMTWFPKGPGNIARIQLDAACTLVNQQSGVSETFYLIAPCRAERMYLDEPLFQMPNYEFCGIWSADEFLIMRTHWVSARDNREHGVYQARWDEIRLDLRHFPNARLLTDDAQIVQATLDNLPLVARTILHDPTRDIRAILEYPIKTMNLMQAPPRFQVDTGPLIVPDFSATVAHPIEQFEMAHVVYHNFDKAEFILRKPVDLAEPTTDYSVVDVKQAQNEIWAAALSGEKA